MDLAQLYNDLVFGDHSCAAHSTGLHRHLEADLAPLLEEYPDVEAEILVAHAPPANLLVSEPRHAVLVVVGRHHAFVPLGSHLGPIARTVLRESNCPVLIVEPGRADAAA